MSDMTKANQQQKTGLRRIAPQPGAVVFLLLSVRVLILPHTSEQSG